MTLIGNQEIEEPGDRDIGKPEGLPRMNADRRGKNGGRSGGGKQQVFDNSNRAAMG